MGSSPEDDAPPAGTSSQLHYRVDPRAVPKLFQDLLLRLLITQMRFENGEISDLKRLSDCTRSVSLFLHDTDSRPAAAAAFMAMTKHFEFLLEQGQRSLIGYHEEGSRPRTANRRFLVAMASACLEVLVSSGKIHLDRAAAEVARHAAKWPGIGAATSIKATTIINWRDRLRAGRLPEQTRFDQLVAAFNAEDNWRAQHEAQDLEIPRRK